MLRFLADREQHAVAAATGTAKRVKLHTGHHQQIPLLHVATLSCFDLAQRSAQARLLHIAEHSPVTEVLNLTDRVLVTLQKSGVSTVFIRQFVSSAASPTATTWIDDDDDDEEEGTAAAASSPYRYVGHLNIHPDEVIRSVCHNHDAEELIIVSVYPAQSRSVLRCRAIKTRDVVLGKLSASRPILAEESLRFPGWVEISESNSRILSYCSETQKYKVWSMDTYAQQYEIDATAVTTSEDRLIDVKASPGFLSLVYAPTRSQDGSHHHQKIRLLDIMDGSELFCYVHRLKQPATPTPNNNNNNNTRAIRLVEQFGECILIKEGSEPGATAATDVDEEDVVLINLRTLPLATPYRVDLTPSHVDTVTILHRDNRFLTFQADGRITTHDARGRELCELKTCFASSSAAGLVKQHGKIILAKDQETLLSVRQEAEQDEQPEPLVTADDAVTPVQQQQRTGSGRRSVVVVELKSCSTGQVTSRVPLPPLLVPASCAADVTCVYYDDERLMLVVGLSSGAVSIFA